MDSWANPPVQLTSHMYNSLVNTFTEPKINPPLFMMSVGVYFFSGKFLCYVEDYDEPTDSYLIENCATNYTFWKTATEMRSTKKFLVTPAELDVEDQATEGGLINA